MTQNINLDSIFKATVFAACKHEGQVRKDQRHSPYVTHPIMVANAIWEVGGVKDSLTLISAILHDVIEDTKTTATELKQSFGEAVLNIVLEVSDDKTLKKMERKRLQVLHAQDLSQPAKIIKLADKLTNCKDILHSPPEKWTLERRQEYIQWAADVVHKLRGTNLSLEDAFDKLLSDAEHQLGYTIQPFETISNRPWAPI